MSRCNYIDAARGAAIIPMIINHTGHAWLIPALSAGTLFYLTEATAAPLFLFVAGFSLTLSWSRTNTSALRWKINNVLRAVFLIVLGYFLNLLLFPGQLLFFMGPLQTIGLGTLLLIPLMPILKQRWARYLLILLACTCYGVFAWHAKAITNTILFHHDLGKMFFFSLPPWPWIAMVMLGAAIGAMWCTAPTERAQQKMLHQAACWGSIFFLTGMTGYLFLGWHDFNIYFAEYITWLPGVGTALWMTGIIPLILMVAYHLQEWEKLPQWLLNIGRSALIIYVLHRLFIISVMSNMFHFSIGSISGFIVVNVAMLFVLSEIARFIKQLHTLRVIEHQDSVT
jgi:uncharacterized membrane protein